MQGGTFCSGECYGLKETDGGCSLRVRFSVAPLKDSRMEAGKWTQPQGDQTLSQKKKTKLLMNTLKIPGSTKEHESAVVPD